MARKKTGNKSDDTVTFTKAELRTKIREFLRDEGACDVGEWYEKARKSFLDEEVHSVEVTASLTATYTIRMPISGNSALDKKEASDHIQDLMDNCDFNGWDTNDDDFEITSVKKLSDE